MQLLLHQKLEAAPKLEHSAASLLQLVLAQQRRHTLQHSTRLQVLQCSSARPGCHRPCSWSVLAHARSHVCTGPSPDHAPAPLAARRRRQRCRRHVQQVAPAGLTARAARPHRSAAQPHRQWQCLPSLQPQAMARPRQLRRQALLLPPRHPPRCCCCMPPCPPLPRPVRSHHCCRCRCCCAARHHQLQLPRRHGRAVRLAQ